MVPLTELLIAVRGTMDEWLRVDWVELQFAEAGTALLVSIVLLATALFVLLARGLSSRRASRTSVALPAILPVMRRSSLSATRHGAFLVFLLGIPCFAVALADPRTAFIREEQTYLGRRIAILVDASASMVFPFETARLRTRDNGGFYTAVAAAEHFMKLRMRGPYRDLIALIEFGSEAYVVTPFTTDHENILLSIRLISNPKEWRRLEDSGTTISQGIEQGIQLFKAFDFVNASGNLMVIFSDGQDGQTTLRGRPLDDIVAGARKHEIPIYMIRTAYRKKLGDIPWDELWKAVVERTGGRFYAASDESTLLRAVDDIDKLSAGRIDVREYSVQRPRFSGYALIAVALWLTAGGMKLGLRCFRTFP